MRLNIGDTSANLTAHPALGPMQGAKMRVAYYQQNGPAREVLKLGEVERPRPGPGEVRVRLATSGVNPSDVLSRAPANGLRSV
jgi:hypothetical protein